MDAPSTFVVLPDAMDLLSLSLEVGVSTALRPDALDLKVDADTLREREILRPDATLSAKLSAPSLALAPSPQDLKLATLNATSPNTETSP
jgi:hypothetical protein